MRFYIVHEQIALMTKFLTADIGGGTVDIVIHKKLESGKDVDLQVSVNVRSY